VGLSCFVKMHGMIIKIPNPAHTTASVISVRCPSCRHQGIFESITNVNDVHQRVDQQDLRLGQRRCPNPVCRAHLFVVIGTNSLLLLSYPAERIDFDSTDVPTNILAAFEEAITCHANQCYTAAAIMI